MDYKALSKKNLTAIAIIQARCSSTRLPGKVLMPLAGKPMIWHIVKRAESCVNVDDVVVATSCEPSDDRLADFCYQSGIECFRGSLHNVLSRYLSILEIKSYDYVVRVTGDCPLIYPYLIDRQIELLHRHDADMVRLDYPSSLLEGQGVYSSRSLRYVSQRTNDPDDLEHVGSRYFCEHPELFRLVQLQVPKKLIHNKMRITVDEVADYTLMSELYDRLYEDKPISLERAISFLESQPILLSMTEGVKHSLINQELKSKRTSQMVKFLASEPL